MCVSEILYYVPGLYMYSHHILCYLNIRDTIIVLVNSLNLNHCLFYYKFC